MLKYAANVAATPARSSAFVRRGMRIEFVNDRSTPFHLLDGWAASYAEISVGCRQIFALHLPGDVVQAAIATGPVHDIGVMAITDLIISPNDHSAAHSHDPLIRSDQSLIAWLINAARRPAIARVAHLLCEIHWRLSATAGRELQSFRMPLLQDHIGDSTGLTPVHVNRMLRELRERRLAEVAFRSATILNLPELRHLAGFDGTYLECSRTRRADLNPD